MMVEAGFKEESELGSFGWCILPILLEIFFGIDAEFCPLFEDGNLTSMVFDEEVLCIADIERGGDSSGDDIAELRLSHFFAERVGEIDDDELEVLLPFAALPLIDIIVSFDAFRDIAIEGEFLDSAPDDRRSVVASEGEIEGAFPFVRMV